ncbi:phosphatidylethanolamine/phosphatidyl-N-methylethanolamine N-methyltransferase [Novosphingobium fluoreni]|uniref:Phosphatidylethanolamine/phosphatidyl-N-methylethanolamine N-methyltransferase n=1 Tax=Novosphingobium fluoreni TaxID=1391222 RepID=A0A7W6BXI7_9SPHN|nr:methyltransferase domain-containing protein [Novosphingobium fluoreni]MBB3939773.1 phosphatidylethanolamine/phosphatidyl-N-methylethanolamine N-methyltransferase [Novosphingobium fluoreni]
MQTASVAAAYDRWAPVYDLVFGGVFSNGRRQAIVAAENIGGLVLEVGVGTGISLPHYSKRTRLVGIDISEAMLEKARRRADQLKLENVEEIAVGDAEALTYPDNAFDVVVAQYVVTAVPNPEKALDEFVRVVRPGGEIVIATRISANGGLRDTIEKALMPITSRLGWRTEFPWSRYEAWAKRNGQVRLLEHRPLPPLGHFSLVRYRKLQG